MFRGPAKEGVVTEQQVTSAPQRKLLRRQIPGPHPRGSDSVGLAWHPGITLFPPGP